MAKVHDVTDAIGIYKIGEGYAIAKDGSLTVGFRIQLPALNNLNAGDFLITDSGGGGLNLNSVLQIAIKNLPDGYIFHQQDIFFYDKPRNLPETGDYLNKSILRMYNAHQLMTNVCYIFLTKRAAINAKGQLNLSNAILQQYAETVKLFTASIDVLKPTRMNNEDWLFYLHSFFSQNFSDIPPAEKILQDISFKDKTFGDDHILQGYSVVGDKCIDELTERLENSARSSSGYTRYNSFVYPIAWGVSCPKIINNIVVRENGRTITGEVKDFESKVSFASKFFGGVTDGTQDFTAAAEDGFMPIYHHFNVLFFLPKEKAEKDLVEQQILTAFSKMLAIRPNKLSIDLEEVFLGSIGGCTSTFKYPSQLYPAFLDEAVSFSNVEGPYAQARNGIILSDTNKNPVVVDLDIAPKQKNQITNYNWIIVGPPGTGKSVFTNKVASAQYSQGHFLFIIDNGDSYKNLCQLIGGKYVELTADGKAMSFAPFLLPMVDPDNDPDPDKMFAVEIDILVSIIFNAWDNTNHPAKTTRQTMVDLLTEFYKQRYNEKKEFVSFDDIYAFVKEKHENDKINKDFFDAASFLLVMKPYTTDGNYGFLFNGEENIFQFDNYQMVVFELGKVADNAILYELILSMLVILGNRVIRNSKAPLKNLYIDECWQVLLKPFFGEFIKHQSKTARKMGGGIKIIVQQVYDILRAADHAEAIIGNADTLVLLSHEGQENQIKKYQQELSLPDEELAKIFSVKKANHEVYIKQGSQSGVYGVNLSPEEYAVFSSTKEERDIFWKKVKEKSGHVPMAIDEIVAKGGLKYLASKQS